MTDSIACLNRQFIEKYQIEILPINIYADGKVYRDWLDINPGEAYKLFLKEPDSFRTAAPSPEDCLQALRRASRRASNVLVVTVSLSISTVYNVVLEAAALAKTELPGISLQVIDSHTAAAAEGFVALAAARAAAAGKTPAEALAAAGFVRDRVQTAVLLDTVRHVYRSGRVPRIAAHVGSVLSIRPIFTIDHEVRFAGAVRSRQHGIDHIIQMMRNKVGTGKVHVAVMHAFAPEAAEGLRQRVAAEFDCAELWLTEFSPVMGYACGTGTLGLAFYSDDQASGGMAQNPL